MAGQWLNEHLSGMIDFDANCLREVLDFLDRLQEERNASRQSHGNRSSTPVQ